MSIYMDSHETKKIGAEITNSIEYLRGNIKFLYECIDKVDDAWESNEATEYIRLLREKNIPELEKLCSVLEKYNDFINNVPNVYETLDEIFSSRRIDF